MLDDATKTLLEQLAAAGGKPLHEMTPEEARDFVRQMREAGGDAVPTGPDMAKVVDRRVPVSGGFVPVRLLIPSDDVDGVLVWYHGGGWVIGTIDDFDAIGRELAGRTNCAVVMVDYRLAPEYRFPTAADDAWEALQWTVAHIEQIAGREVPVIVAGDSAGGNLAAVVALRARAHHGPHIALQALIYPVTDADLNSTSYLDPENQLLLSRDSMVWFWNHYAPTPEARIHPDASPLQIGHLDDLPAAIVITAEHDVLRAEGELYATRLVKAGIPVRHRRFDGQMHGFFTMLGVLPECETALQYVSDGIRETLSSLPPGEGLPGLDTPTLVTSSDDTATGDEAAQVATSVAQS